MLTLRNAIVLLAAIGAAALTARLGVWQLDRAAQKTALQQALQQQRARPALAQAELAQEAADVPAQVHRSVRLQGRWLAAHTVYLENRQMNGRPGFYAVTPLQLSDGSAVLVQRGWVPRDLLDRTRVAAPPPPEGAVQLLGRIAPGPARLYEFAGAASGPIRQNLDVASFARESGLSLRPLAVVQEEKQRQQATACCDSGHNPLPAWKSTTVTPSSGSRSAHSSSVFMSGSNSSGPHGGAATEPVVLTVHGIGGPDLSDPDTANQARTRGGRLKMLLVLLVCASPVIASYLTYFVIRPEGRTNYSTLILPTRSLPAELNLRTLEGAPVTPKSLHGQWLMVLAGGAACDTACEERFFMQRQLREMMGRERERLEKLWLVTDDGPITPALREALGGKVPVTVLRADAAAVARWLQPEPGHQLHEHLYIIDPMGEWMMRTPAKPEPARVKRDIDRVLRASSFWDKAGRGP